MAIEAGCVIAIVNDAGGEQRAMAISGVRGLTRNADGHRDGATAPAR
jgi:hypothetical protein